MPQPPDNEKGRLVTTQTASEDSADLNLTSSLDARCRVCGHRIWSDRSLAEGVGAECRRRSGAGYSAPDGLRNVAHLRPSDPLPAPRPTVLAWTAGYLVAQLREELPKLRLDLLHMEERADLETALAAAARAVDTALDASNARGGWSA